MNHPKAPSLKEFLDSVKDLQTSGTLAQNPQNGMLYVDVNVDWVFNALALLQDSCFIDYSSFSPDAYIKIVTAREAEDYGLFGEKVRDASHLIGKTVDFKVKPNVSFQMIDGLGIERVEFRVKSPELRRIRKKLTGLSTGPINGYFVISQDCDCGDCDT